MRCHRSCAPGRTEPGACSATAQRSVRHDPPDLQRPEGRELAVQNRESGRWGHPWTQNPPILDADRHDAAISFALRSFIWPPGPKRVLCYTKTTNAGANEAAGATEAPSPFADSARAILLLKSLPPPVLMVLCRAGDLVPPSRATRARPTRRTTPETCRPCRAGRTAIRLHSPPDCCRDGLEVSGMPPGHAPTDADALSRFSARQEGFLPAEHTTHVARPEQHFL